MQSIQKYFKPTLADKYIELSLKESEREELMAKVANELRQEFESNSEKNRITTYQKLFFVVLGLQSS